MKKVGLMLSCGLLLGCATSNVNQSTAPTKAGAQCTSITLLSDPVVIALDDPPVIDIEEYVWGQEGTGPLGLYRNRWKYKEASEADATGSGWERVTHPKVVQAIQDHPPNVCKPIKIRIPRTSSGRPPTQIRRLVYTPIDLTDGNVIFK
jgi:hypothetical protein